MKKLILAAFFLLAVATLLTVSVKMQRRSDPQREVGTIKQHAERAKARGEQQVVIPGWNVEYVGGGLNLDEALSRYRLVVAQPIQEKVISDYSRNITTWYKLKIAETISPGKAPSCFPCFNSVEPPGELLPLSPDEVIVARSGGGVIVDGVNVIMESDFPPLSLSKKYLFLLSVEPSGIAAIGAGPAGVFAVNDDGSFAPIIQKPHAINSGMQNRYGHSLKRLQESLKGRSFGIGSQDHPSSE
jgi:hypothetical protein